MVIDSLNELQKYIYRRQIISTSFCSCFSKYLLSLFFILLSAIFSSMEIRLSSLNFSSVWEPFYELKLYFPLSVLPRLFYILTESFIAVHLFHILVPLKLLGEYHLVLAICYNSCYWFVLHKIVRMTALCQTKGLSTSVSFSDDTRCRGKIIGKKERKVFG